MGAVVVFVVVILILVLFMWISHWMMNKNIETAVYNDPAQVIEENAVVTNKCSRIDYSGSMKMPTHSLSYMIEFTLDNRTQKELRVSRELYDEILVGEQAVLVTQNDNFVDFGNRTLEYIDA